MISLVSENICKLTELCHKHRLRLLSLVGSAAREADFSKKSDLDFVYEFDQQIPVEEYATNYFSFQTKLKTLFQRQVDLIPEQGSKNPYFLQSIAKDKVALYEA